MKKDRGSIWLGVANLVENEKAEWLVVKKQYSGLKGMWSIPAGFVNEGETIEQAALREVLEETNVTCEVQGLIGFRSGVIKNKISDNMAILYSRASTANTVLQAEENEIAEVAWIHPKLLVNDALTSSMLLEMAKNHVEQFAMPIMRDLNPGQQFGYTDYQLFFKKSDTRDN